jgi:hypothetical protein
MRQMAGGGRPLLVHHALCIGHTVAMRLPSAMLLFSPRVMLQLPLASACWCAFEAVHAKHQRRSLQHSQRLVPSNSRTRSSERQCGTASAFHCCQPHQLVFGAASLRSPQQTRATTRWCALRCRGRPRCAMTSYPGFCAGLYTCWSGLNAGTAAATVVRP